MVEFSSNEHHKTVKIKKKEKSSLFVIFRGRMRWSQVLREFSSELLGTMVLITFGCGSVAQSVSPSS